MENEILAQGKKDLVSELQGVASAAVEQFINNDRICALWDINDDATKWVKECAQDAIHSAVIGTCSTIEASCQLAFISPGDMGCFPFLEDIADAFVEAINS